MTRPRWFLAALALVGCGEGGRPEQATPPPPPPRVKIHVAAASDLQKALPGLIRAYRQEHPDVEVVTTFGASGQLAEQIKGGAPFAVFLSANEGYVKTLASEGLLVEGSARPYAVGTLVIAAARDAKSPPKELADLARSEYRRIAIANPDTAPFGAAARQALTKAGIWSKVRLQLVFADSVRQALQFIETGGAEAGLVSKALIDPDRIQYVEVDPADHDPIVQWLGRVARVPTEEREEAERFTAYVLGEMGTGILQSFGLKTPPSGAPAALSPKADPAGGPGSP